MDTDIDQSRIEIRLQVDFTIKPRYNNLFQSTTIFYDRNIESAIYSTC